MRVRLVPLEGGSPIEVAKDLVLVGRKEDCDLRLDHKSISKLHCVIVKTDGLLLLRALGSTTGTRANDQLQIASVRFSVQFGPDEPSPAPDEYTQQLDGRDLARLLEKAPGPGEP